MRKLKNNMHKLKSILKGDCVVLIVENDKLIVDAGNHSAEEVKTLASTFFKTAYKLKT